MFVIGAQWGTAGVALGWIIGFPIVFVPLAMRYTLRVIGMPWRTYGSALWPALSGSIVMVLAVLGVRLGLPDGNDTATMALRLVVMVTVGVLSYLSVMYLAHRERLRTFRTFLRTVRK